MNRTVAQSCNASPTVRSHLLVLLKLARLFAHLGYRTLCNRRCRIAQSHSPTPPTGGVGPLCDLLRASRWDVRSPRRHPIRYDE